MTLEEIYKLEPKERLTELKKRKTELPDAIELMKDWDEKKHSVFDDKLRTKRRVMIEDEVRDAKNNVTKPAKYEWRDVNRIAVPIEQDIVNIHTAFTVGVEPSLKLESTDEPHKNVFDILKSIFRLNKIKYQNKKAVRSWLSEKEVAEYWYTIEDSAWWKKVVNLVLKIAGQGTLPTRKLKSTIWSPFRGDKLYPYFDDYGDLIVISREYESTDVDGTNKVTMFMSIDKQKVTIYKNGDYLKDFDHMFEKIPVIYMYRPETYCSKIKPMRERFETLLSNFADCLDFNFFPKLAARGVVEGVIGRNTGSEIIQLENGAEISYLTWQQSPEMAKLEFDNLTERMYGMTNTPRITFENLKGTGNTFSGVSFKYAFMSAHMAVSNHAEDVEEFLQRRVNFVIHAIGKIYPKLQTACEGMEVSTEVVPFTINNKKDEVDLAVSAYQGGIASRKEGIILSGLTDAIEDELKAIEDDEAKKNEQSKYPIG